TISKMYNDFSNFTAWWRTHMQQLKPGEKGYSHIHDMREWCRLIDSLVTAEYPMDSDAMEIAVRRWLAIYSICFGKESSEFLDALQNTNETDSFIKPDVLLD